MRVWKLSRGAPEFSVVGKAVGIVYASQEAGMLQLLPASFGAYAPARPGGIASLHVPPLYVPFTARPRR